MTYTVEEIAATLRSWGVNSVRQMEQITTELLVNMPTSPVISGGGSNQEGAGDPISATPDFDGQYYEDTDTGNLWKSNSTTTGDWSIALQNMQVKWSPDTLKMGQYFGLTFRSGIVSPTAFVFEQETIIEPIIVNVSNLQSVSFPNLVSVDPDFWWGTDLDFGTCQNLTTFEAPLLETMGSGSIILTGCTSLTSLSLPSLVSVAENINCATMTSLSSVSFPLFSPDNGKSVLFNGCALTQESVDHILSRCVANAGYVTGIVKLEGGTNSAPSGTGALMVVELQGRGVTVNTN